MSNVRLRRLTADYEKLKEYARLHPRVRLLQVDGDPPERYQIQYQLISVRMVDSEVRPVKSHTVEIVLPRNYPRTPPQCRMLSPVFHPNIAPHAICVGDHWTAGESLQSIVIRIGEMLAYQSYNVKSPLNGEAAKWAEEHKEQLPLDPVSLLPEEVDESQAAHTATRGATTHRAARPRRALPTDQPASQSGLPASEAPRQPRTHSATAAADASQEAAEEKVQVVCPGCQTEYQIATTHLGRRVRCKKCQHVFSLSEG
ncbi:MAG: zinc-ribbon domain-containing protein [Planctomycetaceae bacterium]|nr:zinc-ribbon domain-containing protein [Planctomycetaceae bacterium]